MRYCKLKDCETKHHGLGYCPYHLRRYKAYGNPLKDSGRERHGMVNTREYYAWYNMRSRCNRSNIKSYNNYGAKGVTVCDRWNSSFNRFLEDMGKCPSDKHEIDRIDNSKGYTPDNCRWSSPDTQNQNRRTPSINKSGYKGIYKRKDTGTWSVTIGANGKRYRVGCFDSFSEALGNKVTAELHLHGFSELVQLQTRD